MKSDAVELWGITWFSRGGRGGNQSSRGGGGGVPQDFGGITWFSRGAEGDQSQLTEIKGDLRKLTTSERDH